jgi:hypothetical protein
VISHRLKKTLNASTAAVKGISILDAQAMSYVNDSVSQCTVTVLTVGWDQRLLLWEVTIDEPCQRHFLHPLKDVRFHLNTSLLTSVQKITPYQNQFEYYYNSCPSSTLGDNAEDVNGSFENDSAISVQLTKGIVVYIAEVASCYVLSCNYEFEKNEKTEWLCSVIGEGFQVIRIKK